jgi:hypothetical protein
MWGGRNPVTATPITPLVQPDPESQKAAQAPPPPTAPTAVKINPDNIDFGEVKVGQSKEQTVQIENTGAQLMNILEVRGTCGCLKLEMPEKKIEPGKSQPLKLTFVGQSGRRQENYTVTVVTDEPAKPASGFLVKGKVIQVFFLEPQTLYYEFVAKGRAKTLETTLTRCDGKPFEIKNISAVHPEFSFTWAPVEGKNKSVYKIQGTVRGEKPGIVTEGAAVLTDHPEVPALALYVSARITGDVVSLTPQLIATRGSDGVVEPFSTVIKRLTPGRIQIESVTESHLASPGPAMHQVEFESQPIDDVQCTLIIRLKGTSFEQPPQGEFVIKTNVEETPLRVPYRAVQRGPLIAPGEQKAPQRAPRP